MTTWKVLKDDRTGLEDYEPPCWREVGEFESEHSYYLGYTSEIVREIGERHGAGDYLFLGERGENDRYVMLSIGSRQEFYEITSEDDPVLNVTSLDNEAAEGIPEGSTLEAVLDPRD